MRSLILLASHGDLGSDTGSHRLLRQKCRHPLCERSRCRIGRVVDHERQSATSSLLGPHERQPLSLQVPKQPVDVFRVHRPRSTQTLSKPVRQIVGMARTLEDQTKQRARSEVEEPSIQPFGAAAPLGSPIALTPHQSESLTHPGHGQRPSARPVALHVHLKSCGPPNRPVPQVAGLPGLSEQRLKLPLCAQGCCGSQPARQEPTLENRRC